jgi:hypothetical protein
MAIQQTATAERLFMALNQHDHAAMADCYDEAATFFDIAFDLRCKRHIQAMWHMISHGDIRVTFKILESTGDIVRVNVIDEYTFSDTCRSVRNEIQSRLVFKAGRIVSHIDDCDPRRWAAMAFGGVKGLVVGRSRGLRQRGAHQKLKRFICTHSEYRADAPL